MGIKFKSNFRTLLGIGLLVLLQGAAGCAKTGTQSETNQLHEPQVLENANMSTGQETVWSCLYFGAYPSAEIVANGWNAVDEYALQDGDVIVDDELYESLSEADWENNQVSLDGKNYVRISSEDAVTAAKDREQHYRWEDMESWHFFLEEPIRWRVLSVRDGKALLLADRILDCAPFHESDRAVTWEACTLRSWLNGYDGDQNADGIDYAGAGFYDLAFNEGERESILSVTCKTPANKDYGTDSGPDTQDKVFLLSNEEVYTDPVAAEYGFYAGRGYDDPSKRFSSTLYAKCKGAWWSPVSDYKGNSFWFMRTSGYTPSTVTYICDFGYIYSRGTLVTCDDAGVLPAICIELETAEFTYAGETSSEEILREEETADEKDASDSETEGEQEAEEAANVTWPAVAFGTWPQTEILASGAAADGEEADSVLWNKLQKAEWDGDRTSIDGADYCRLNDRFFRYDPIIWRVLEMKDGTAFLLSDKALDCISYHASLLDVNWSKSTVRSYLNSLGPDENLEGQDFSSAGDGFFNAAFTEEEKEAVLLGAVSNADNHYFGTSCGEDTYDRVFLLSEEEIFSSPAAGAYGFQMNDAVGDPAKRFKPTAFAKCRGAWQSEREESKGNGFWILRSNGYTAANVVYVGETGDVYNRGIPVTCKDASIVPAIRINLDQANITFEGEHN
ncbi:MAG: DUF6273 domain-containing protein [Lachnospiraceae bacterium]|nr:DUF6273 domain-containing protein [Lachnospiraceae bacterium]